MHFMFDANHAIPGGKFLKLSHGQLADPKVVPKKVYVDRSPRCRLRIYDKHVSTCELIKHNILCKMPLIKIERIVSFTSEDPIYTASNILLKDTSKKWKCKIAGEKSASVVLQLDQPYLINGIDIGNEQSAYIEVLVSRSSIAEDYKVLLVMSSFMTPLEARQGQNINKVRMFKQEDFSEPERNEKWDRVMIVCTQPFNRHVQYGLSFINLYTNDQNLNNPQPLLIGKFLVRPESPDNISTGTLFARRKEIQESTSEQKLKGAAAIREATSLAHIASPAVKNKLRHNNSPSTPNTKATDETNSPKPRNRNELLYSKDEEDEHDKFAKLEQKSDEKLEDNEQKDLLSKDNEKNKAKKEIKGNKNIPVVASSKTEKKDKIQSDPKNKRKHSDELKHTRKVHKKKVVGKPFARLLEGIVLVISGIQNPERASLRSMALSMGAKYKTDWDDNTCTHLVCAFANTPKFNQVKGKGKIIKKNWLEDCYNKKKRLPWRRYALDNADKGTESEEEICEQKDIQISDFSSESDAEMKEEGSDTEDNIKQIKKKQKQITVTDMFQTDTENELVNDSSHNNLNIKHNLKSFFHDKLFYVDKTFEQQLEKKIKQYIVAYKGILVDKIQSDINIIVTNKSNYQNAKDICSSTVCIAPDWIWECHNCQKIVSMDDYIIY